MKRLTPGLVALVMAAAGCIPTPPPPADLVIGDSNTVGSSWATTMGTNCAPDVWAWGGVGVYWGSPTYAGGMSLLNQYETILAYHPGEHVVVMLGTNDAVHTNQPIPTAAQLNTLAGQMVDAGAASVRWMTIPPVAPSLPAAKQQRVADWNTAILGTPEAIDVRAALGTTLDPTERVDNVHLSQNGHGALAYVTASTTVCPH